MSHPSTRVDPGFLLGDADPSPADLRSVAFHREKVRARRHARRGNTPFDTALMTVLQAAAGNTSLRALVATRHGARQQAAERKSQRGAVAARAAVFRHAARIPDPQAWHAWFDGSATPNPGRIALGARLQAPDGRAFELSRTQGHGDSCVAEYRALIAVLEQAVCTGVHRLVVHGDSRIIIDDVLGAVPVRTSALCSLQAQARALLKQFQSVSLVWIPRARNRIADALARQAQTAHGDCALLEIRPDDGRWRPAGT